MRTPIRLSSWRKVALVAWGAPRDPTAYGTLDLDCERVLSHLDSLREQSGEKVTLTHFVGRAVAYALASMPEVNAFVSRGHLVQRATVDVFFQVAFFDGDKGVPSSDNATANANLAGAKIVEADQKSVVEIARELRERANAIRLQSDAETVRGAKALAKVPRPLLGAATALGAYLSHDLNLNLSRFGIPYDAFGSCMVTNVGVFGITEAHAPLFPLSRVPLLLTVGAVRDAPSVHEGQIVIRKRITIGVTFDHRVMDGYHAGVLSKRFCSVFGRPELCAMHSVDPDADSRVTTER